MQIKLKFKWKVKRFFLLLTCQVFKVQGSVFLFQHLAAETPRVEWRDFLLTLALFIISEVSTNVFNTTQHTQTGVPAPVNLQSEPVIFLLFWYITTNFNRVPNEPNPPSTSSFPLLLTAVVTAQSDCYRISRCRREQSSWHVCKQQKTWFSTVLFEIKCIFERFHT